MSSFHSDSFSERSEIIDKGDKVFVDDNIFKTREEEDKTINCLLCDEPCVYFGIFECGHHCCGFCSLRIFIFSPDNNGGRNMDNNSNHNNSTGASSSNYNKNIPTCPICRKTSNNLFLSRDLRPTFDKSKDNINNSKRKGEDEEENEASLLIDVEPFLKALPFALSINGTEGDGFSSIKNLITKEFLLTNNGVGRSDNNDGCSNRVKLIKLEKFSLNKNEDGTDNNSNKKGQSGANIYVNGSQLYSYVSKMNAYLCPFRQCWGKNGGNQDEFDNFTHLKEHLFYDHNVEYCGVCVKNKPVFLFEQKLYDCGRKGRHRHHHNNYNDNNNNSELQLHYKGLCWNKDPPGSVGHPECKFCLKAVKSANLGANNNINNNNNNNCDNNDKSDVKNVNNNNINNSSGSSNKDDKGFGRTEGVFGKDGTDPNNYIFYDVDKLIKHMQNEHFICDICNRREFLFTYYANRAKLLEHFTTTHKLCTHPDCLNNNVDPMLRVFASESELEGHCNRVHGRRKGKGHNSDSKGGTSALEDLGFTFGSSDSTRQRSRGRGDNYRGDNFDSGGNNNAAIQTGYNLLATRITFDYVYNKEVVVFDFTGQCNTGSGGRGRGARGNNNPGSFASCNDGRSTNNKFDSLSNTLFSALPSYFIPKNDILATPVEKIPKKGDKDGKFDYISALKKTTSDGEGTKQAEGDGEVFSVRLGKKDVRGDSNNNCGEDVNKIDDINHSTGDGVNNDGNGKGKKKRKKNKNTTDSGENVGSLKIILNSNYKGKNAGGSSVNTALTAAAVAEDIVKKDQEMFNSLPNSPEEREKLLKEKLSEYFKLNCTSAKPTPFATTTKDDNNSANTIISDGVGVSDGMDMFRKFAAASGEFINGRMLTTEYYKLLSEKFFPKREMMDEIFPLIASTITNIRYDGCPSGTSSCGNDDGIDGRYDQAYNNNNNNNSRQAQRAFAIQRRKERQEALLQVRKMFTCKERQIEVLRQKEEEKLKREKDIQAQIQVARFALVRSGDNINKNNDTEINNFFSNKKGSKMIFIGGGGNKKDGKASKNAPYSAWFSKAELAIPTMKEASNTGQFSSGTSGSSGGINSDITLENNRSKGGSAWGKENSTSDSKSSGLHIDPENLPTLNDLKTNGSSSSSNNNNNMKKSNRPVPKGANPWFNR